MTAARPDPSATAPSSPAPERPSALASALVHPAFLAVGIVVFVLSFVLPEDGVGIPLCWFKVQSGLPCPGCGLTRSVTASGHFHWMEAFRYHPFGPLVWLGAGGLSVLAVIGGRGRLAIRAGITRHARTLTRLVWLALFAFLVYGFVRVGLAAFSPESFSYL